MSYYADNDDDLFEDEIETVQETVKQTSYGKENVEQILSDAEKFADESIKNIHGSKVGFVNGYRNSLTSFLEDGTTESFAKSINVALNTITNGEYQYVKHFYEKESRIARIMHILAVTDFAFYREEGKKIFKEVSKIVDVELNDFFIETCFKPILNVMHHSLEVNRALYLMLSKRTGIPVRQELFDTNLDNAMKSILVDEYSKNSATEVMNNLIADGLLDELQQRFNRSMRIANRNEE